MKQNYILPFVAILAAGFVGTAFAKLPAPSEEAKAKAAETAAKSAWTAKVEGYLLCKSQDKTAAHYYKTAKATKPAVATPPCADPGAFVYPLPVDAVPVGAAPVSVVAPAASPAKKP